MDNQRAQFILQSFRPDGGDAHDPDFAEALAFATEDRELGEWLARERAQDAAFTHVLADLEIPEDLRDAVMAIFESDDGELTEFDSGFIGALASVRAPEGLRDQILDAMEVEQKVVAIRRSPKILKWASSAVAVIAVMAVVFVFFGFSGGSVLAGSTPQEVEYSAIEMLESPFFSLDQTNDRQAALYEWLEGRDLPSPEVLPEGLRDLKGVGCKLLKIGKNKHKASLVCYRQENDNIVHLVMMERVALNCNDLCEINSAVGKCRDCDKNDEWAVTQWADAEHAFLLLSKMKPSEMASLFE